MIFDFQDAKHSESHNLTISLSKTRMVDFERFVTNPSQFRLRLFNTVDFSILDTMTLNTTEGLPSMNAGEIHCSEINDTDFLVTIADYNGQKVYLAKFTTSGDTIARVGAYHTIADTTGDANRSIRDSYGVTRAIPGPDADRVVGLVYLKNNTNLGVYGEIWVNTSAFSADWNTMTYNNEWQHIPTGYSATDDFDQAVEDSTLDIGPLPYVRDDTKTYFGMWFEMIFTPGDPLLIYKFNGASSDITVEHVESAQVYRYIYRDDQHWFVTNGQLCAFYHNDATSDDQDSVYIFTVSWNGSSWVDSGQQEFKVGTYLPLQWWAHLEYPDNNQHFLLEMYPNGPADNIFRVWDFNVSDPLNWVLNSRTQNNPPPWNDSDVDEQPELFQGWHYNGDGQWTVAWQSDTSGDFYGIINGVTFDVSLTDRFRLSKMKSWEDYVVFP